MECLNDGLMAVCMRVYVWMRTDGWVRMSGLMYVLTYGLFVECMDEDGCMADDGWMYEAGWVY